ncbi:hypothetical protein [Algirhabdus cladophorae]|uniref:hypothetical protein n=1 Tax=Algirhabdus cladophorae TaxID=3377108 RepID=UPI003B849369
MDILKTAVDWTKAEMLSSSFFILFGIGFMAASLGFWQVGKTEIAKAYVIPLLIAGVLLLIIGLGIFIPAKARVTGFAEAYAMDAQAFISAELAKAERILGEYRIAVYRVIPLIVALCAVLFVVFSGPVWRASFVTTISMMAVIMMIDTNANTRLEAYKIALAEADAQIGK